MRSISIEVKYKVVSKKLYQELLFQKLSQYYYAQSCYDIWGLRETRGGHSKVIKVHKVLP